MACPSPSRAFLLASLATAVRAIHDWDSGDHWFDPHGHSLSLWVVIGFLGLLGIFIVCFLIFAPHGRHHPHNRHLYDHGDDFHKTEIESGKKGKMKYKHKGYRTRYPYHATPYGSSWYYGAPMAGPVSFVNKE